MASLPNPDTPMAFLPKEIAYQVTFAGYVVVSCLAVCLWDFLDNIPCDILLLTRYTVRLPTVSYLFARIITVVYFFFAAAFMTFPIGSRCYEVGITASALFAASVAATNFLFLLRVRAMYNANLAVTVLFTTLWLSVVASSAMLPWALPGGNIGPTDYCIQLQPAPYLITPIIAAFVNDTLVFIAITRRLMQMSTDAEDEEQRGVLGHLRMFRSAKSLPIFSRVLLRDNQFYYFASITLRSGYFIVYLIPTIPTAWRMMFGLPCLIIFHILVCRVFRRTKLGSLRHAGYCDVLITRAPTFGVGLGLAETEKTTRQMGWPLEFHVATESPSSSDDQQNDTRSAVEGVVTPANGAKERAKEG